MVTLGGATTSMLLMVDFAGSVMASEDYWALAPRPVSSRTYFAARLSAVLPTSSVFRWCSHSHRHCVSVRAWPWFRRLCRCGGATVLASVAGAGLVIAVLTSLVTRVSASRLVPVISFVHLWAR